jgi:two-component system nitrate/nitrite response regulator NarL
LQEQKLGLATLTPTERQILKLIAEDRTSKEIAEVLGCSIRTVETHRQNISRKLELSGSHSLLRFAFDHKAQL